MSQLVDSYCLEVAGSATTLISQENDLGHIDYL